MKKSSVSALLIIAFCFCGIVRAQQGNWQIVKTMNSVPDCSECGMAAIGYKSKIYILDVFAYGEFPNQVPMADVYSYDTKNNTWEQGGEIPADRRRAGAAAAEYRGKLYLVAGIKHGYSSGTNSLFDCYDPESKTWTILTDAPHIRDHYFASVVNSLSPSSFGKWRRQPGEYK